MRRFIRALWTMIYSLFIVCLLLGRVEVLMKAPKKYVAAPQCAFLRRGRDRMDLNFLKFKPICRAAWRSRLTARRFAHRICGGRAVTGPPRYRSQEIVCMNRIAAAPTFL